jgi:hypothetical protein
MLLFLQSIDDFIKQDGKHWFPDSEGKSRLLSLPFFLWAVLTALSRSILAGEDDWKNKIGVLSMPSIAHAAAGVMEMTDEVITQAGALEGAVESQVMKAGELSVQAARGKVRQTNMMKSIV